MKKKIMTLGLAAAITVSTAASFAGSREPLIQLVESGQQGLHLYMDSLTDLAKLSIFDRNGVVLFRDKVNQRFDFKQKFNLSKLPDGTYTFEIESGNRIKKYQIEIIDSQTKIDGACEEIFKPVINQKGELLDVSYLNLDSEDVTLEMIAPGGDQIVRDDFSGMQTVSKRYNLSKLPSGVYLVVVKTEDRSFTFNVAL